MQLKQCNYGENIKFCINRKGMGMSRVFVTIPRFQVGVPITLGVLTGRNGTNGPMIAAYPTYAWQSSNGTNCNGITSVFRVAVSAPHICRMLN